VEYVCVCASVVRVMSCVYSLLGVYGNIISIFCKHPATNHCHEARQTLTRDEINARGLNTQPIGAVSSLSLERDEEKGREEKRGDSNRIPIRHARVEIVVVVVVAEKVILRGAHRRDWVHVALRGGLGESGRENGGEHGGGAFQRKR